MANIIYRESTTAAIPSVTSLKGAPLSNLEIDGNFRSISTHLATHDTNISSITYDLSVINNSISTINNNKPSNTGTGATGTWAINVTGNAGTVTNGVYTTGNQTVAGTKTFSSTITGSISGNAGTVTDGVYTSGDQTISGVKTFNSTISGSVSGNAGTVTNGVYTNQTYANPVWITSLDVSKLSGNISNPSWINALDASKLTGSISGDRLQYATATDKGAVRISVIGTSLYIFTS